MYVIYSYINMYISLMGLHSSLSAPSFLWESKTFHRKYSHEIYMYKL